MTGDPRNLSRDIHEKIRQADRIALAGHTNPDGDAIGACLGLAAYILDMDPEKTVDVLLDPIADKFRFLAAFDRITQKSQEDYDLFFALDCADPGRMRSFEKTFDRAAFRICIDHHVTNAGFGDLFVVIPEASSTCEILFDLFDYRKISLSCAQALFMGIVHDTGVFRHSNNSRKVMETAGALMDKGLNSEKIINETFYEKSYRQNLVLGRALLESILLLDGRMIFSVFTRKDFRFYGVDSSDLEGIVSQLKLTQGTQVALFLYEIRENYYKISLRSTDKVDVSAIAALHGGGGHKKAAGCTIAGTARDIVNNIAGQVEHQLDAGE